MVTQTSSTIVSNVFTSRNILLTQLNNRGFDVSNYINFSVNEINLMLQNKQCDILVENEHGHKVYVKYHLSKAIRPSHIYDAIDDLFHIEQILNKDTDQLMIITKVDANDTITNCLTQIFHSDSIFVTIYGLGRLQFNILNHNLVPKHVIMTPQETQEMFKTYNVSNTSELPEISRFDPVAIAIGIRPGQVCKIYRKSKTAVNTEYYRLCQ